MEITLKIDGIDVVANSVESGEMNHDAGAAREYSGASVDGNHAAASDGAESHDVAFPDEFCAAATAAA